MPRQGRIQLGTGVYHVMMRGINRQCIFEDSEDHYTFLLCLRRCNPCSPAKKTRRCQTVATDNRYWQKHNIKCIKKIY